MASRDLRKLHYALQPLAERFLFDLKSDNIDIIVTCTYRSNDEQNALYEQGRSAPGHILTNAKGGQSEHNFTINGVPASKAFDIVPIVNGKCDWYSKSKTWAKISEIWSNGYHSNGFFLDWYGRDGAEFPEFAHFCLKTDDKKEHLP
jgi:peptidoglycan L-alanyl-D-glutamate endopeptidase CwlK